MKRAGWKAKVRIGDTQFACQSVDPDIDGGDVDVSNTEGEAGNPDYDGGEEGGAASIGDIKRGTLTCRIAYDDETSPWLSPLSLVVNNYYAIKVYPSGLTGPEMYDWPNARLRKTSHSMVVPGGQPVTVTFVSDGIASLDPIPNPDAE